MREQALATLFLGLCLLKPELYAKEGYRDIGPEIRVGLLFITIAAIICGI